MCNSLLRSPENHEVACFRRPDTPCCPYYRISLEHESLTKKQTPEHPRRQTHFSYGQTLSRGGRRLGLYLLVSRFWNNTHRYLYTLSSDWDIWLKNLVHKIHD